MDVDLAAGISRHDPGTAAAVFGSAAGLAIGGHHLHAVVGQPEDCLEWVLSWASPSDRTPVACLRLHTYEASSVYAERSSQRAPGSCSARLSLLRAQVDQWFPTCDGAAQVTSWVTRHTGVLCVRVIGMGAAALVAALELVAAEPATPTSATASVAGGALHLTLQGTLPTGRCAATVARATGAGWQPHPTGARGALTCAADSVYVAAAVGCGDDAATALAAASGAVDRTTGSYEAVRELEQQHRADWREYWRACLAAEPAPPDAAAWYLARYEAGCQLGGSG